MKYVVHKSTREPGKVSYAGVAWADSKMKSYKYFEQYDNFIYANAVAKRLSEVNPVGFEVHTVDDDI